MKQERDAGREIWTIGRLLDVTGQYFRRKGLDSPRLDAELLLCKVLGCERLKLFLDYTRPLDPGEVDAYRELVRRRAAGEPAAHITGKKEFFSLLFEVNHDVLIPRPDTELLVELALDHLRTLKLEAPRILDIGAGSGCIAIALAKHLPTARIVALDCSPAALAVARRNAEAHGVESQITWLEGHAPQAIPGGEFDVIVSNPPYISEAEYRELDPGVRDHEPGTALLGGNDGLDIIRCLLRPEALRLTSHGVAWIEFGWLQGPAVLELALAAGWPGVVIRKDLGGRDRCIELRSRPLPAPAGLVLERDAPPVLAALQTLDAPTADLTSGESP
ncbi:MAG: Release factor glutamine methyltransferase [Myxococcota bacterium]|nr:Release factor glutamine methyltransferase [Myxococcota bacterium]